MNDLIVRRTPSTELPALAQFHPLPSLRDLLSWDPFQEMAPLLPVNFHRVIPPFEVRETKDRFVFMADLPGVEAKDIEISPHREQADYRRHPDRQGGEGRGGGLLRPRADLRDVYPLVHPSRGRGILNAVQAHLSAGVLTVVFPKVPAVQPKKIPVTVEKAARV